MELKINFSDIFKCACDLAQSGASDRLAIKWLKRAVTWQCKERPITRRIKTVDLHLSEGGTLRTTICRQIIFQTI